MKRQKPSKRQQIRKSVFRTLEAISKPQIRSEGKAKPDEKAEHTWLVCEYFEEGFNTAIGR
jgi:hypothetical protein